MCCPWWTFVSIKDFNAGRRNYKLSMCTWKWNSEAYTFPLVFFENNYFFKCSLALKFSLVFTISTAKVKVIFIIITKQNFKYYDLWPEIQHVLWACFQLTPHEAAKLCSPLSDTCVIERGALWYQLTTYCNQSCSTGTILVFTNFNAR